MKIGFEQLRSLASGYFSAECKDGEIIFHRFTAAQEKYYLETSPRDFYVKTAATSGIRLDFYTDADSFGFDYRVTRASSRTFYFFDILIDGVLKYHLGEEQMWINKGRIDIPLPAGEHRLTVWFPCLTAAVISNVTASDGASFRPASYSRRMICFGDSISQGYDALYPMLCYTNRLADHFDAYMLNLAIGGEKFVPGLLSREFAGAFRPDIITVAYGTNDWSGFDRDTFFRRCDGFLEKLAEYYPDSERFVITPLWRADRDRITRFGSFDEAVGYIADKAAACGHHVIDGYGFLPHYPGFFSDLRLHPNDLGYGEYVRGLVAAMEKVLDR
ncbi:MAG: SGNH/GDSL hydrolase family protein [Clostridia bacterium]|nr:SGNH/GDSL hydrolase family protein [Clostridia bacterium]